MDLRKFLLMLVGKITLQLTLVNFTNLSKYTFDALLTKARRKHALLMHS